MQNQPSDKARNALGQLAARYTGETGFPARDIGVLQQHTAAIVAAFDAGDAAIARVAELEAEIAELNAK